MGPCLNQALRISEGPYAGLFRILAITPEEYFLGVIHSENKAIIKRGPKPKLLHSRYPTSAGLLILPKNQILELVNNHVLLVVEITIPNDVLDSIRVPGAIRSSCKSKISIQERFEKNKTLMKGFLDPEHFRTRITLDRHFGSLVSIAAKAGDTYPGKIYRLLSRLIRFGMSANSLIPEHSRSGGRGNPRPYIEGKTKKPGAKSGSFKLAIANGKEPPAETPGMSQIWKDKCKFALESFVGPHPSNTSMYTHVLKNQFMAQLQFENGKLESSLKQNAYPTKSQFSHFLRTEYIGIKNIRRRTTSHNFNQNHRGLIGKSHEGVSGPGHTYAIDSTLGDIYLLSTLNRQLIIGRPVHYMIVDVWSGAIVGFYVCLNGPSWEAAKIAIFCATYDSIQMAQLRGIQHQPIFRYPPGLPMVLLSDRGEYIALAASETALNLKMDQEFTAPYRGDGKGIVEVQFASIKGYQLAFIPGTHDAKRIEMEARKSKPLDATFTLHEYAMYLSNAINNYNLTADMRHRADDYMRASDVNCTPAGLWDWGHENGIGYSKVISETELIRTLLPKIQGTSTPKGLNVNTRTYANQEDLDRQIAAEARSLGSTPTDIWIYPGNIQNIWTSQGCEKGLRKVERSGMDSSFVSEEEYLDVYVMSQAKYQQNEHERTKTNVLTHHENTCIVKTSIELKRQAVAGARSSRQDITANRQNEWAHMMHEDAPVAISKPEGDEDFPSSKTGDEWLNRLLLGGKKNA